VVSISHSAITTTTTPFTIQYYDATRSYRNERRLLRPPSTTIIISTLCDRRTKTPLIILTAQPTAPRPPQQPPQLIPVRPFRQHPCTSATPVQYNSRHHHHHPVTFRYDSAFLGGASSPHRIPSWRSPTRKDAHIHNHPPRLLQRTNNLPAL
jgi:hypothetical protein